MVPKALNGKRCSVRELVQQGERLCIEFVYAADGDQPSEVEVRVGENALVRALCLYRFAVCAKRCRFVAEHFEALSSEVMRR